MCLELPMFGKEMADDCKLHDDGFISVDSKLCCYLLKITFSVAHKRRKRT